MAIGVVGQSVLSAHAMVKVGITSVKGKISSTKPMARRILLFSERGLLRASCCAHLTAWIRSCSKTSWRRGAVRGRSTWTAYGAGTVPSRGRSDPASPGAGSLSAGGCGGDSR